MPTYNVRTMLFLAAASIIGLMVFLTQFRTHRAIAMIAFVVMAFIVVGLCAATFIGARLVAVPVH